MDLTFKPIRFKNASDDSVLSFRVFQGSMRISINNGPKSIFDRPIPDSKWLYIIRQFETMLKSSVPGQKIVVLNNKWSVEAKKAEPDWVLAIIKDDKQCFVLQVEWAEGGKQVFPIRGLSNTSSGTEPMPPHERSMWGMEELIDFAKFDSKIQKALSNDASYWRERFGRDGNSGQQQRGGAVVTPRPGGGPAKGDYF